MASISEDNGEETPLQVTSSGAFVTFSDSSWLYDFNTITLP